MSQDSVFQIDDDITELHPLRIYSSSYKESRSEPISVPPSSTFKHNHAVICEKCSAKICGEFHWVEVGRLIHEKKAFIVALLVIK